MTADLETSVHGTLLRVAGMGVLLTGPAGSGKSSLALELVQRGHCLVADDLVILTRCPDHRLHGRVAADGEGFLVVRGLGMVDVVALFGAGAASPGTPVDLLVGLLENPGLGDPLRGQRQIRKILGVALEELALEAARPGLPVLVEVAVRDLQVRRRGYRADERLASRLRARFERDSPCE